VGSLFVIRPNIHTSTQSGIDFSVFLIYSIYVPALYWVTFAVNLIGLVLALWLGIYLVSRSPRFNIAWLTALTLWSLSGVFLNVLLALNPPPAMLFHPELMRYVFLFWPAEALVESRNNWLLGWSVAPAVVFWHHATILMRPGRLNIWRWVRIWTGYLLAILSIIAQANAAILFSPENSDPLLISSMRPGSWYAFFGGALLLLTLYSAVNLGRSARSATSTTLRKRFRIMAFATLIAGVIAPVSAAGSAVGLPIPMVVIALLALIAVVIIGYDVARYSAMMEGRTIQRDFFYNLMLLALVLLVYLSASVILILAFQAPQAVIVFIPVLAVVTHSLMSTAARLLDWVFFRKEARQLRSSLQRLMRQAGEGVDLDENLARVLDSLCTSVRATYGLILIYQGDVIRRSATYRWDGGAISLKPEAFAADDVLHLPPGCFQPPLEEAALLVPLYSEKEQLGALVLGRPVNGIRYSDEDVTNLLNLTDRIGEYIAGSRREAEQMKQIVRLSEPAPVLLPADRLVSADVVEDALRNLYDYTYLGDTPLAAMRLTMACLSQGQVTCLERGKAVHAIILESIEKLRPGASTPRDPLPRDWYPYLILKDAYIEEVSNREIMMRLYISEGTFNRTRRGAVRSLARAMGEMEAALS
jgi:GAF domain-containing protein